MNLPSCQLNDIAWKLYPHDYRMVDTKTQSAGEGVSIEVADTFEEFKENVDFMIQQFVQETFSYETYSFDALEFIVCRYYNHLPRVKLEQKVKRDHMWIDQSKITDWASAYLRFPRQSFDRWPIKDYGYPFESAK